MRKVFFLFLVGLYASIMAAAQQPNAGLNMADYEKIKKMTPAQLEAYKQKMVKEASEKALTIANSNNIALDKARLPGIALEPPVKDIKRLQLLPSQPPTKIELTTGLKQSEQQIRKGIPAPKLEEIQQAVADLPVEAIQERAIMDFYADDPRGAIAMMMQAAVKAPDSLQLLNNLGAMLNLQGGEHIAIPVFQYCLQRIPGSSTLLNNIGQSFMALGDMLKAAAYFNQCLSIDSLNTEANHSMGMLHYFKKEYDASMKYFEREMSVAVRASTLAMAYRMGRKFNLRGIMQRRKQFNGRPEKDHFEEITMGRFVFPQLPGKAAQVIADRELFSLYAASIQAEQLTWMGHAVRVAAGYTHEMGNQHPGLYTDLVNAMLEEAQEEFTPEYLTVFTDKDYENIREIIAHYTNMITLLSCPETPAGAGIEAQEAYEIKCCRELKQPLADRMTYQISSYVQPLIRKGELRWKSYINQLVDIVQLDPGPGNQALVYNAVAGYFNFLSVSMASFSLWEVNNLLPKCFTPGTTTHLDSLIESDRSWRVDCPKWLNAKIDFNGMAVSVDCSKYSIEAGSSIAGAYEYEFKSGKSTLLIGPSTKAEFLGIKATLKEQAYITFDNNKQFADFGIKTTGDVSVSASPFKLGPGIKLGGTVADAQVTNSWSINSGFKSSMEGKGLFK
ncbi:MAG TPA: hypothetical protein PK339_15910 [Flavitalea sp.]|nr:hypothetical protein [Flavitalea sp.]